AEILLVGSEVDTLASEPAPALVDEQHGKHVVGPERRTSPRLEEATHVGTLALVPERFERQIECVPGAGIRLRHPHRLCRPVRVPPQPAPPPARAACGGPVQTRPPARRSRPTHILASAGRPASAPPPRAARGTHRASHDRSPAGWGSDPPRRVG